MYYTAQTYFHNFCAKMEFGKIKARFTVSNILSIAILALAFSLLSPTTDSLSNIKKVYGYGAGLSVENISVLK